MQVLVTQAHTSGWDVAASVGTIVGAVATAAAVIVALVLGAADRREARSSMERQLEASRRLQTEEHAEQRRRRVQEYRIDLLLRLGELVGEYAAGLNVANHASLAQAKGRAVAAALLGPNDAIMPPRPDSMPAVRAIFAVNLPDEANMSALAYQNLYQRPFNPTEAAERASAEIAQRLRLDAAS